MTNKNITEESRKKGVVKYSENPFLISLMVPIKKQFSTQESGIFLTNTSKKEQTGECVETACITKIKEVDEEQFLKLYTTELKHFFNLKPSTQKI